MVRRECRPEQGSRIPPLHLPGGHNRAVVLNRDAQLVLLSPARAWPRGPGCPHCPLTTGKAASRDAPPGPAAPADPQAGMNSAVPLATAPMITGLVVRADLHVAAPAHRPCIPTTYGAATGRGLSHSLAPAPVRTLWRNLCPLPGPMIALRHACRARRTYTAGAAARSAGATANRAGPAPACRWSRRQPGRPGR